jgi:hypothetical protein
MKAVASTSGVPDSLGELEVDRFRIDPEGLVEPELGIKGSNRRGGERLLPVPWPSGRTVHEKERDGGNRHDYRG